MRFRLYSCWRDLPASYGALFARAGASDFCLSRAWFESLAATALDGGDGLRIAAIEAEGSESAPLACLVGHHRERDPAFLGARSFASLSNYYTLQYAPLVEGADAGAALVQLAQGLRARRPRYAVLHFEPLAAGTALLDDLAAALCAAGLVTRRYFRSGNWYDDTRGLPFRGYLASRPTVLRQTFLRRSARLARTGSVRVEIVEDAAGLADALCRYERVYDASWKRAEPHPAFIRSLAWILAEAGALRLGLLHLDQRPIAAQIWIVWHGRAILYKLAHDRTYDAFSPGTVLTMRMLERLLDDEHVAELDLGAGDDPYKRLWASRRRARVGLVGFDPLTPAGAAAALRHAASGVLRKALSRRAAGQDGRG